MDRAIVKAVLQDIFNLCTDTPCGDCPFDDNGCPFRMSPNHWDADSMTEYLDYDE